MSAKGYALAADVTALAAARGVTLTAGQQNLLAALIEAAENRIDRYLGRGWLMTSPVTNELHQPDGPLLYLKVRPVTAITSITTRPLSPGASATTLAATAYELIDAANGIVLLSGWGAPADVVVNTDWTVDSLLSVTYTATTAVPADVAWATKELVLAMLRASDGGIDPSSVQSYSVGGGDFSVTYRAAAEQAASGPLPHIVADLLAGYRRPVLA